MPVITNIEDLRVLAEKRVPRMFYDYADSGSWTEGTYRANESDFAGIKLRQRVAVNMEHRSLKTTMAGQDVAMPVALAPVGLVGMQHADGEILAARASEKFGVPFTLSTMSICSIEDVAENVSKPFWFQLYVMRDRDFIRRLIDRAKAAECSALVLTLDLQIMGQRHKDIKNGLAVPPSITLRNLLNMSTKPRWGLGMLGTSRRTFRNVVGHVKDVDSLRSLSAWSASQLDPTLTWDDVQWIKDRWGGKLILKGIMDEEDAEIAVRSGADAIIVSNHGGRQLDGAPSSIAALPPIARAVGDKIEVLMDGGIRTGQDVIKALALGAKGVFIGRAFVYGLGAMGEAGVSCCLEIIRKELDLTMAFCGLLDVKQVDRKILVPGTF
jgi:L-lactate dehydrogenase (cytochrome)